MYPDERALLKRVLRQATTVHARDEHWLMVHRDVIRLTADEHNVIRHLLEEAP